MAAKTNKTTAMNHIKKESHQPLVSIAPAAKRRANAPNRSAGASGHCGARGPVITILFIKGWAGWARKFTNDGYTGRVREKAVMPPACDPVFRTSVPMMVMRVRSFRQIAQQYSGRLAYSPPIPGCRYQRKPSPRCRLVSSFSTRSTQVSWPCSTYVLHCTYWS